MTFEPKRLVSVTLHKEHDQDEPLELDVDLVLACACGREATKREQLYKESDTASVLCFGCGAEYEIAVRTTCRFEALITSVSEGFTWLKPSRGRPHVE